jgi:hypothetical protein
MIGKVPLARWRRDILFLAILAELFLASGHKYTQVLGSSLY